MAENFAPKSSNSYTIGQMTHVTLCGPSQFGPNAPTSGSWVFWKTFLKAKSPRRNNLSQTLEL